MSQEPIGNLIQYTVSEDHERPDLEACLEITDRVNGSKPECMETIMTIVKNLSKPNYKVINNCLLLLETLCKNCNMRFLYELNNKKLTDALFKVLDKRREAAKAKKPYKGKDPYKTEVEDKILYLVQLWADTFMMHQAEFKNIHAIYRDLRKDGVKFPDRDPNEKFMISFQGQVSPIFLAMDENYIVPSNNQGGAPPDPRTIQQKPVYREPEYAHEANDYNENRANTLYNEDVDYDYSVYDGIEISSDEVKVLEESLNILKDIEANAMVPGDMKSEIANEILGDMVHVHKRVKRLIGMDKFSSSSQRNTAMRINDNINAALKSFRARYNVLKDNYRRGIKTQPLSAQITKPEVQEEGLFDDDFRKKMQTNATKGEASKSAGLKEKEEKPEFVGARKLAPPKGWKGEAPTENAAKNTIDLLDLLDAEPISAGTKEERKEDTPASTGNATPNLMSGLMDLNFDASHNTQQQQQHNQLPYGFQNQQQQQFQGFNGFGAQLQQFNTAPQQFNPAFNYPQPGGQVNFMNPGFMTVGANVPAQGHFSPQQTAPMNNFPGSLSPGGGAQVQSPVNNAGTPNVAENKQAQGHEDDEDFFGSIANRNK